MRHWIGGPIVVVVVLLSATACEELGNPTTRKAQTGWLAWTNGVDATATNAVTVSASDAAELLRDAPREQIDHLERVDGANEFFTLVTVRPKWGRAVAPSVVRLVTHLDFGGGRVMRKVWTASASRSTWVAGFAVPFPPEAAATAIGL